MPRDTTPRPVPSPQDVDWQPRQAGTLVFDRVRLDVAAGTFAQPVTLHLAVPADAPPIPEHLKIPYVFRVRATTAGGQAVTQLERAIRFTIDFADLPAESYGRVFVSLYYFDETEARWRVVPAQTDMEAGRIVADVDHFTDFGFGGDGNQQPSTPPNLEGYQVDLCTGYASASIPLKVPPGTAGLTPRLELRYNSGTIDKLNRHWIPDGNNTGNENTRTSLQATPVGLGWSLDLGAIYRENVDNPGENWPFYLVLNGQTMQLVYVDGTLYNTNPDDRIRVRKLGGAPNESAYHEYWLVETKDGTQYRFGYNSNSEEIGGKWNFGGTKIAWRWNLDLITDTHGNTIEIQYDEVRVETNDGTHEEYDQAAYPSVINYTANPGQGFAASRQIRFFYSDRDDHATHTGYTYTQYYWKKKLDRVEM